MPDVRIDLNELERRCCVPSSDYLKEGVKLEAKGNDLLIHKDRNAKVLAVAHLDWVGIRKPWFAYAVTSKGKRLCFNNRLDDRLGAYIALDYLPKLGVECDVLLTDNEEKGRSTAADFKTDKEYNWIFQFDRRGDDVVLYNYATDPYEKLLRDAGFHIGQGSYTCIRELESLGVLGFNVACGYYRNHCEDSYCDLAVVDKQVDKFLKFYEVNKDTKLPVDPKAKKETYWNGGGYYKGNTRDRAISIGGYSGNNHNSDQCDGCFMWMAWGELMRYGDQSYCSTCRKVLYRCEKCYKLKPAQRMRCLNKGHELCYMCEWKKPDGKDDKHDLGRWKDTPDKQPEKLSDLSDKDFELADAAYNRITWTD